MSAPSPYPPPVPAPQRRPAARGIPADRVPRHVAVVMDGNGRWANERGLPRTEGHEAGEAALLDVVAGAIEIGVTHLSAYAFSTENWKRSPDEVRFLMGFNRDVIRRRRDQLHEWGVRVRWAGRRPRLWGSVINELEVAEELTRRQHRPHAHDVRQLRRPRRDRRRRARARRGRRRAAGSSRARSTRGPSRRYLDEPDMPDVDLFVRSSGEQRTSNFLLWQSAYAEMVFLDTLWPDFDRRDLWRADRDVRRPRPPLRRRRRRATA